jgi:hypothetical protein
MPGYDSCRRISTSSTATTATASTAATTARKKSETKQGDNYYKCQISKRIHFETLPFDNIFLK